MSLREGNIIHIKLDEDDLERVNYKSLLSDYAEPAVNGEKPTGVVKKKSIRRQQKRQHMYLLTIAYLVTGVLNIVAVINDLQPAEYWSTHEAIYIALGDPVYADPDIITDYDYFFNWLKEITQNFFYDPNANSPNPGGYSDKYIFRNYIFVHEGIMLLQWKRKPPTSPVKQCAGTRNIACGFGSPAWQDYADPFEALLDSAQSLIQSVNITTLTTDPRHTLQKNNNNNNNNNVGGNAGPRSTSLVDFYWLPHEDPLNASLRIDQLSELGWLNPNTSQVNVILLLYNPSLLTTSRCVITIDFNLGGLITTTTKALSFSSLLSGGTGMTTDSLSQLVLHIVAFVLTLGLLIYEGIRTWKWLHQKRLKQKEGTRAKLALAAVVISAIVSVAIVIEYFILTYEFQPVITNISDNGNSTNNNNIDPDNGGITRLFDYINILKNFDQVYNVRESYKVLNTLNLILFGFRLFTLLHFFRSFRAINVTLVVAFMPILTFVVYVVIVLALFSVIATIQFGAYSSHFDTFPETFELLFRFFAMWDFDYEGLKSYQSNEISFVLFYVAFSVVMIFVLVNMFLAIIYASFETTSFLEQSVSGHGFLIWQTFQILIYSYKYTVWPRTVLEKLDMVETDDQLLPSDFVRAGIDQESILKIYEIYGEDEEEEIERTGGKFVDAYETEYPVG